MEMQEPVLNIKVNYHRLNSFVVKQYHFLGKGINLYPLWGYLFVGTVAETFYRY
jgi:hypothetical protein